jgi:hypothetical protein
MPEYVYIVRVEAETEDQATQVIQERIEPEEDLGFEYSCDWSFGDIDMLHQELIKQEREI